MNFFLAACVLAVSSAVMASGNGVEQPAVPKKVIMAVMGAPVRSEMVSSITNLLKNTLMIDVDFATVDSKPADWPSAMTAMMGLAATRQADFFVGLVNMRQVRELASAVDEARHVAVINTVAVKNDTRAVTREVFVAMGRLLGLADCPFPVCAMYKPRSEQEAADRAVNYCPPCWQKAAGKLGIAK